MLPTFVDGVLFLYELVEENDIQNTKNLKNLNTRIWFEERGVSDRLRSQLNASNVDIEMKVRIAQNKKIGSMSVVKIDDTFYKVYNAYHFEEDGVRLSDLTLVNWSGNYEER